MGTKLSFWRSFPATSIPARINPPPQPREYHIPGHTPITAPFAEPPNIIPAPICTADKVAMEKGRFNFRPASKKSDVFLFLVDINIPAIINIAK